MAQENNTLPVISTYVREDGIIDCDVNISQEEWRTILRDPRSSKYIDTLVQFLKREDHKGTCSETSANATDTGGAIRNKVTSFGRLAHDILNRVDIIEDGQNRYWPYPMTGREMSGGLFEWRLRDELAAALKEYFQERRDDFVSRYPAESIASLPLEKYTNTDLDSFCYELEFGLEFLGQIKGGFAYKFGIFKMKNQPKEKEGYQNDGVYGWLSNLKCDTYDKAYEVVRERVSKIAVLATQGKFREIEEIDYSPVVKWKIAYLYSNFGIVPIFKQEMLESAAGVMGMDVSKKPSYMDIQDYLKPLRGDDEDRFEFYYRVLRNVPKQAFGFKELKAVLRKRLEESENFAATGKNASTYQWVGTNDDVIGDMSSHYEFCADSSKLGGHSKLKVFVEAHFEDKDFAEYKSLGLIDGVQEFDWGKKQFAVRLDKDEEGWSYADYDNPEDLADELMASLIELDSKVGSKIKSIKNSIKYMDYTKYTKLLKANYNLVLTGAPGTGKTYLAFEIANELEATKANGQAKMVQFHPSYDYTDFVEGLRPKRDADGFERIDGVFKSFCAKAAADQMHDYVFIIDEINRGEFSKIFGELFFSIDPGYRGDATEDEEAKHQNVLTQYQNMIDDENDPFKDGFYVPKNVYIVGTMNDIDRSVESMDFAIRRRFAWMEVTADERKGMLDIVIPDFAVKAKESMEKLNKAIESKEVGLTRAYHVGPAYYLKLENYKDNEKPFEDLWNYHIKGLLEEYLRGAQRVEEKMKTLEDAFFSYQKA